MFVAATQLKVGPDTRQVGDPVPEAARWPNLKSYLDQGKVWIVQEGRTITEQDRYTEAKIRRAGVIDKLVGLGVLRSPGQGGPVSMAEVGTEIADGARITTGEIETMMPETAIASDEAAHQAEQPKRKRGRGGRR